MGKPYRRQQHHLPAGRDRPRRAEEVSFRKHAQVDNNLRVESIPLRTHAALRFE